MIKRQNNSLISCSKTLAAVLWNCLLYTSLKILDTKTDVVEKADAITLPHIKGDVEFKDVSFSYDGEKMALENFTLSVKAGESVALVGPSGAGKTTLANLLPRFYDVTGGSITIDGYDIKDVTFKSLREQIGLVPQETVLLDVYKRQIPCYL